MIKRWKDLLGTDVTNTVTDDRYIVVVAGRRRRVLMAFASPAEAQECYAAWLVDVAAYQGGGSLKLAIVTLAVLAVLLWGWLSPGVWVLFACAAVPRKD